MTAQPSPWQVFHFDDRFVAFEPVTMQLFQVDGEVASALTDRSGDQTALADVSPKGVTKQSKKAAKLRSAAGNLAELTKNTPERRKAELSTLWLNLAHTCNLQCLYCFANCGDYGKNKSLMAEEIALRSIDFLFQHAHDGRKVKLVFFGGEPLVNYRILKSCVLYAESLAQKHNANVSFLLITNGTLLKTETAEFIKSHGIRLQLSLDGPAQINDRIRPFPSGVGSFNSVYDTLLLVKRAGVTNIAVRSTLTHYNCDVAMLHRFMESIGFSKVGMTPVQADSNCDYALTKNDLVTIKEQYRKLALDMIEAIRSGRETELGCFSPYVLQLLRGQRKRYYCSAGHNSLCVTPEGKLYPCHRLISKSECEMGSVDLSLLLPKAIGALPVEAKVRCSHCWARYLCGGGCEAAAYEKHQLFSEPDETLCEVTLAAAENALRIYYTILAENLSK